MNGDIVVWNPVLERAYEISSMGIRVDREALLRQLDLEGCPERAGLEFHRALLEERIPLSVGGGIGQSRLCMFLLRCAHIGEDTGEPVARPDEDRMHEIRHFPQIK